MLFDRVYRLLVGKKGSNKGLEITELHIKFEIQKTSKKDPNTNTVQIWNLQQDTRREFEKPDTRVVLYAGYKEDRGPLLLFQGNVTHAWSKIEGPDIITEFELGDGTKEMRDSTISVGYSGGVKSKRILNDASKKMDLPLTMPSDVPEREWRHGFSYYGSTTGLLDKITKGTGLEWSVQNGDLQVIEHGMVTTRQGIELAVDSGLIKSPERIRKSKTSTKSKKKGKGKSKTEGKAEAEADDVDDGDNDYDGWTVKSLLMPTINPGDRVKLSSRFVTGVFRVEEIKHSGDSHEGDWESEMKLVDPAKPIAGDKKAKGGDPKQRSKKKDKKPAKDPGPP